ncbi:MAG: sugar phosphate isomerase/epimerase [Cyclobacteriaceae bacterium]|nr:sugar phosphate isomerase/epimerase [Cyclobacteriaceae bacterium]
MVVRYLCPYWGQEGTTAAQFLSRVMAEGYDGVEINLPADEQFIREFQAEIDKVKLTASGFGFVAQQVLDAATETVDEYIVRMKARLEYLAAFQPDFINSHTGKDYFSFDDNCRVIEATESIAVTSGVSVLHEIHRGRFTFHAATLLPYLKRFPELKLTGDFSHWCTVSESMLNDQQHILDEIFPHVRHIHARVGYEHSPQVNNPFAPEWQQHLTCFMNWWREVIAIRQKNNEKEITITPEFGPVPYMPTLPYSREPVANQWQLNVQMKKLLKDNL